MAIAISPILFLAINDRYGHIYTISFDNCIKFLIEHTAETKLGSYNKYDSYPAIHPATVWIVVVLVT